MLQKFYWLSLFSLEEAKSKMTRIDSSDNGQQTGPKMQARVEAAEKSHTQNVERVKKERVKNLFSFYIGAAMESMHSIH